MKAEISDPQTCRGKRCGKKIRFIRALKSNKRIPVDADVTVVTEGSWYVGKMMVLETGAVVKEAKVGTRGYLPHWVSCPDAGEFKRRRPTNET